MRQGGPPDVVFLTGDLGWTGHEDDYARVDAFLGELRTWLGHDPIVVPVPGGHDVRRPKKRVQR